MPKTVAPLVNALNRPFWEAAEAGILCLPWCLDTDRAFWPPSPNSPFTGGTVAWREARPTGVVESIVIYRRAFQQAFAGRLPYGIASVALADGPRLMMHVEDPDAPGAPRAGADVEIRFQKILDDGRPLPVATALSQ